MAIVVILDTLAEHVHLVQAEQEWMLDKTSMPISLTKNTKVPLKSHICPMLELPLHYFGQEI